MRVIASFFAGLGVVAGMLWAAPAADHEYWTRLYKTLTAAAKERDEFAEAAKLAVDGKFGESAAALESFEKSHPKSGLLPQVKEALAKAQSAQQQAQAAAEAMKAMNPQPDVEPPAEGCGAKPEPEQKPCDAASPAKK
jgi:hypothetical protein